MEDLDMLYDYYKDVNTAAGGYATLACRIKDDRIEKLFQETSREVLQESRITSEMIIKYGGTIF
ncbi:MAG: spore coat protein [Bacillota bacterium]